MSNELYTYMCDAPSHPMCLPLKGEKGKHRNFEFEFPFGVAEDFRCPTNCPEEPTTTPAIPPKKRNSIFKRNHHGGMLIMTNFCLMPVASFIARFYKETFNISRIKGVKVWFWVYMSGIFGNFLWNCKDLLMTLIDFRHTSLAAFSPQF